MSTQNTFPAPMVTISMAEYKQLKRRSRNATDEIDGLTMALAVMRQKVDTLTRDLEEGRKYESELSERVNEFAERQCEREEAISGVFHVLEMVINTLNPVDVIRLAENYNGVLKNMGRCIMAAPGGRGYVLAIIK